MALHGDLTASCVPPASALQAFEKLIHMKAHMSMPLEVPLSEAKKAEPDAVVGACRRCPLRTSVAPTDVKALVPQAPSTAGECCRTRALGTHVRAIAVPSTARMTARHACS
jgi:hypothetical protein